MTETLKYELVERQEDIEIRRYAPYIKAEVGVEADNHRNAITRGFNALADFIFGNNVSR